MRKLSLIILSLLSISFVGCHHHGSEEHEHEHEHAHLQLTAYSEHWEVYAESHPFVVGESEDILAHFTYLENFKPRTEGSVRAILNIGGKEICQVAESPSSPGIYNFALTAEKEGKGFLVFIVDNDTLTIPVEAYTDEEKALHEAAENQVNSSNGVSFTKEQSWKVDFATEQCKVENFGQVIKTMAQIMPSQGDEQVITAKAAGIVLFANDEVVVGKAVTKGQRLFSIESSNLADNNLVIRFQKAASEYERARSEYERKKELFKDKIVSESELLKAKTEYENASIVYENFKQNYSDGKNVIFSPISGYIKQIFVQNDEFVEAGQSIASVSQNKNLYIKASVQPKYYNLLGQLAGANFKLTNDSRVYSLEELGGKVLSYGKATDTENPLVPVFFQINNTVDLLPGSFVEAFLRTQSENKVVTVANTALIEEMGNYFVFVQLTPEFFEKREVQIGITDGVRTEIKLGLTSGERVVSKGAILVKLAQASGKLDAHSGHHH